MYAAFLTGLGTMAGLIIAIGAQNAYLLTQSIRKNHHIKIAVICVIIDVILVSAAVAGIGSVIAGDPLLKKIAAWGGASFLFIYGLLSLRAAFSGRAMKLSDSADTSLKKVVLTTLAVTFLNPHVYIDTFIFIGGVSSQFASQNRLYFAMGACLASMTWFALLTFAGVRLASVFERQITWRMLDVVLCIVMWGVGLTLVI